MARTGHIEIAIKAACTKSLEELQEEWKSYLSQLERIDETAFSEDNLPSSLSSCFAGSYTINLDEDDKDNDDTYQSTTTTNIIIDQSSCARDFLDSYDNLHVYPYQLISTDPEIEELEPTDGNDNDDWTAACENWPLPHTSLQGLWESLIFEGTVQRDLLEFARSAVLFSSQQVSSHIVHWNRLILLHGLPGTGKTSLCRALAQKLSIRMQRQFPNSARLLEIHSHSLFSKWFSTSGKLVHKLFELIQDMVQEDPKSLVCVLIDEIESLASSRSANSSNGSEPTDAIRAVNSLLTAMDKLRRFPNVLVLATTNLTHAVDDAFLDRADLQLHIGLPCYPARYEMLRSCLQELIRTGIIVTNITMQSTTATILDDNEILDFQSAQQQQQQQQQIEKTSSSSTLILLSLAQKAEGLSGRSVRRLPLQAHALYVRKEKVSLTDFLTALSKAIHSEQKSTRNNNNKNNNMAHVQTTFSGDETMLDS